MKKKFLTISLFVIAVIFVIVVMFILFEEHCTTEVEYEDITEPCDYGSICLDVSVVIIHYITTCTTLFGDILGIEPTVSIEQDSESYKMMRERNP